MPLLFNPFFEVKETESMPNHSRYSTWWNSRRRQWITLCWFQQNPYMNLVQLLDKINHQLEFQIFRIIWGGQNKIKKDFQTSAQYNRSTATHWTQSKTKSLKSSAKCMHRPHWYKNMYVVSNVEEISNSGKNTNRNEVIQK